MACTMTIPMYVIRYTSGVAAGRVQMDAEWVEQYEAGEIGQQPDGLLEAGEVFTSEWLDLLGLRSSETIYLER